MGAAFTKVARRMAGVIAVSMATISALSDVAPRVHSAAAPCGVSDGTCDMSRTVSNADGAVL